MAPETENGLSEVFVELADTLTADFDLLEFLTRLCAHVTSVLGADAAGVIVVDAKGVLHVMASSTEQMRVLELFEIQNEEGPCLDALRSAQAVANVELAGADERWPRFGPEARADGFAMVHAFPMHLRDVIVGVVNVFSVTAATPAADRVRIAQALTDIATIGILQERGLREGRLLTQQLQNALGSRVVVEQAKGMVAERAGIEMTAAFETLRAYARAGNLRVADVARDVISGELTLDRLRGQA